MMLRSKETLRSGSSSMVLRGVKDNSLLTWDQKERACKEITLVDGIVRPWGDPNSSCSLTEQEMKVLKYWDDFQDSHRGYKGPNGDDMFWVTRQLPQEYIEVRTKCENSKLPPKGFQYNRAPELLVEDVLQPELEEFVLGMLDSSLGKKDLNQMLYRLGLRQIVLKKHYFKILLDIDTTFEDWCRDPIPIENRRS
jgi:hypothetical protein